jgi:branched-chain amino acid transport system ATP-binding protein
MTDALVTFTTEHRGISQPDSLVPQCAPEAQPSSGTPILVLRGLGSHYGRISALRNVNLVVGRQQLIALVGANGAGKTTLLRTISGVQRASSGRIEFDGKDITELRADKRVKIGICHVPEGRRVFGPLSVEDNLHLGAYCRSDKARIADDLERMYAMFPVLKQKARLPAGTLSGGQQQMLALARGLACEPAVLLLDELSMGLAPLVVEELYENVARIAKEGITILVVEQFAKVVLGVADEAAIMAQGRIAMTGRPDELADELSAAYLGG